MLIIYLATHALTLSLIQACHDGYNMQICDVVFTRLWNYKSLFGFSAISAEVRFVANVIIPERKANVANYYTYKHCRL